MKIDVASIPPEGWSLTESVTGKKLDIDTEFVRFTGPVRIGAEVSRITNAVTVRLWVAGTMQADCSRCLEGFSVDFEKRFDLNYPVDKSIRTIDLDPDIREEILLDYPFKALCSEGCLGLCPKCGCNLNQEACKCKV